MGSSHFRPPIHEYKDDSGIGSRTDSAKSLRASTSQYPDCDINLADINGDCVLYERATTLLDIRAEVGMGPLLVKPLAVADTTERTAALRRVRSRGHSDVPAVAIRLEAGQAGALQVRL